MFKSRTKRSDDRGLGISGLRIGRRSRNNCDRGSRAGEIRQKRG